MRISIVLHTEQAYLRILVAVNIFRVPRIDALHGDINIRLARQEPDVAQHDILDFYVVDSHRQWPARLHGWQVHTPPALAVGSGSNLLLVQTDGDGLAGVGLAPHGNRLATLQDHAVLEDLWQCYLSI